MSYASSRRWAITQVFRGIAYAKGLFFLSVSLAGIALSIPLFLSCLAMGLYEPILSIPVSPEITVFTQKDISKANIDNLVARIERIGSVHKTTVVAKEKAFEELSESLGIRKSDKNSIGNPLPDIIIVALEVDLPPAEIEKAAASIRALEQVDAVSYDASWLTKFDSVAHTLKTLGAILLTATLALVILVIAATVRLNSEVQKAEMKLLYLFGATVRFSVRPYVWRGFLSMAVAAALSVALTAIGVHFMNQGIAQMSEQYGFTVTIALPHVYYLLGYGFVSALLGAFLAGVFARLSVRKIEHGG